MPGFTRVLSAIALTTGFGQSLVASGCNHIGWTSCEIEELSDEDEVAGMIA